MPVGNAACPKLARNPELPLLARFCAMPGELAGVPRVVNQVFAFQALQNRPDNLVVLATPRERFLHVGDRMRAPDENLDGRFIQLRFCFELPWFAEHAGRIEEEAAGG